MIASVIHVTHKNDRVNPQAFGSTSTTSGYDAILVGDITERGQKRSGQEGEDLSSAIRVCAHRGDITQAEKLLRKMEEQNTNLSVATYNAIIHACTQAKDILRAEMYLNRMKEKGIEPDIVTYNCMMNTCAELGDASQASKWLQSMARHGMRPNNVTYGSICKVYAHRGGVEQIEGIMRLLESNGTPLNEYFYASLISACGAADPPDPARAERALMEMCQRGFRPQSVRRAFTHVVGNSRAAQLFEALRRMPCQGESRLQRTC